MDFIVHWPALAGKRSVVPYEKFYVVI